MMISSAAEFMARQVDKAVAPLDITGVQYKILRILKRAYPAGLSRTEILNNLDEKSVDVTRSIDGLVKSGLVERSRPEEDRRMSIATITQAGIDALQQVDPLFYQMLGEMQAALTEDEFRELSRLCRKLIASRQD
jgi:DNA-binding MarR family transcriptional regulator